MRRSKCVLAVLVILLTLCPAWDILAEGDAKPAVVTFEKKNYVHGETVSVNYTVQDEQLTLTGFSWDVYYENTPVPGEKTALTEREGVLRTRQNRGDKIRLTLYFVDSEGNEVTLSSGAAALGRTFFEWVSFIVDKYGVLFLQGTGYTMLIALVGTVAGFLLGLLVAILRTIPVPDKSQPKSLLHRVLLKGLSFLLGIYIEVFRGTPMMVQAMVIYYGLAGMGLRIPTLPAALVIVSVNTGAYMAEIIRGGIISVDKGQKEGAHAIGMTHWQCMVHVVLPQAVRNIMPSIGNEFVVNIKDSSVLNVISVSELFFVSKSAAGTYLRYFEVFFITGLVYLFLTFTVTRLLRLLERKMDGHANYTICGSQSDSKSAIALKKEVPDE